VATIVEYKVNDLCSTVLEFTGSHPTWMLHSPCVNAVSSRDTKPHLGSSRKPLTVMEVLKTFILMVSLLSLLILIKVLHIVPVTTIQYTGMGITIKHEWDRAPCLSKSALSRLGSTRTCCYSSPMRHGDTVALGNNDMV